MGGGIPEFLKTLPEEARGEFRIEHQATAKSLGLELVSQGSYIAAGASKAEMEKLHSLVPLDDKGTFGLIMEAPEERFRLPEYRWRSEFSKALLLWEIGNHDAAIRELHTVLDKIEALRVSFHSKQERRIYFAHQWSVYDTAVHYLVQKARFEEALQVVERIKTRSLIELLGVIDYVPEAIPANLRQTYREAMLNLRHAESEISDRVEYISQGKLETSHVAQEELISAAAAVDQVLHEMTKHCPDFDPMRPVPAISSAQLLELAKSRDHLIVVWWIGKQVSGLFFLSKEGVEFEPVPNGAELESALSDYRRMLAAVSSSTLLRHLGSTAMVANEMVPSAISRIVLAPIEARLNRLDVSRITIVPHHYLHLLPFHALEENGRALIERYAVDYCPSLSLLRICERRNGKHSTSDFANSLIVGNPDGSLQAAGIEAEQISRARKSPIVLRGQDANISSVLLNAGRCDLLHFACHGRSGEDQEEDFALVLAPSLNHTGLLTAGQIASQIRLPPGSVVFLSACSSGQAVLEETDEYVGLAGAFLLAGASVIVASLWPVDDVSTALLMWRVYANLALGMPVSKSLNSAQLWLRSLRGTEAASILQEWRLASGDLAQKIAYENLMARFRQPRDTPFQDPLFWAPFICVGACDTGVGGFKPS